MKIKRANAYLLWKAIRLIEDNQFTPDNVIFRYTLNKNKFILEPEITSFEKIIPPSKEYDEYTKARLTACESFAKIKDGKPETITLANGDSNYIIDETKKEEFDKAMIELKRIYHRAIEDNNVHIAMINSMLEESIELNLFTVKIQNVPEYTTNYIQGLNKQIVDLLHPIIED